MMRGILRQDSLGDGAKYLSGTGAWCTEDQGQFINTSTAVVNSDTSGLWEDEKERNPT